MRPIFTHHAEKRARHRLGLSLSEAKRAAKRAVVLDPEALGLWRRMHNNRPVDEVRVSAHGDKIVAWIVRTRERDGSPYPDGIIMTVLVLTRKRLQDLATRVIGAHHGLH